VDRDYSKALVVTASALNPVTLVDVGARVPGKIENVYVDFISQVKEG
jgi:multidrug efflux pump subunit AcrA (membrane-fusion protein)